MMKMQHKIDNLFISLFIMTLFLYAKNCKCDEVKPTPTPDYVKLEAQENIRVYEKDNNVKLDEKWKKHVYSRVKNEAKYQENYKLFKNVLFKVKSNEKNLDMSYTNKKPIKEYEEPYKPIPKADIERYGKATSKSIEKFYTPRHIENCKKSYSETEANPYKDRFNLREEGEVVFDVLLLSKDVLKYINEKSLIDKDFFGDKNEIAYYSEDFLDLYSLKLKDSKIDCLPYRVIATKDKITWHYGVNALKNYDFNKDGELHHTVKKNINKFLLDF